MTNYHRQTGIFDPSKVAGRQIHVIGCGTIGSWTSLLLSKLGVDSTQVSVWDFDTVEDVNIPSQYFFTSDVGLSKSIVIGERFGFKYHNTKFEYNQAMSADSIFIMCVDSLIARKIILAQLPEGSIVIDGRMGGEGFEVHVGESQNIDIPEFASEDKCTEKGIVYVSAGIAASIVSCVKRILLGQEIDYRIRYKDYRGGSEIVIYK